MRSCFFLLVWQKLIPLTLYGCFVRRFLIIYIYWFVHCRLIWYVLYGKKQTGGWRKIVNQFWFCIGFEKCNQFTDKSKLCISNLMVQPAFLIKFIACSCVALRTSCSFTAKILSPTFALVKGLKNCEFSKLDLCLENNNNRNRKCSQFSMRNRKPNKNENVKKAHKRQKHWIEEHKCGTYFYLLT